MTYIPDEFRAQEEPVTLRELPGLDPNPTPDCNKCRSWDEKRKQARAHGDYAAAAVASEEMWRHQLRARCRG
ncbi:hypothetical protein ACFVFQ_14245 [Streptomyces sp. NPDC057743]|uniref:hypothetical protein n=1 Tax=Streptomyces sp. NPDC057743 TaxID=3346236 RepID=UPI0036779C99